MNNRLNKYKSPGAKRLMLEAREMKDKTEDYCAQPIDDNLFEWHFTVRGPPDTAFDGGYYHGRISFPTEYPMKPPSIILFTPNGRFETNKKICLSISGYHPETWQPSWSVRTALVALRAFMPTKANRAIGSLDFSDVERRRLAVKSRNWRCETCGLIRDLLKQPGSSDTQDESGPSTAHCEVRLESIPEQGSSSKSASNSDQSDCDYEDSSSDSQGTQADSKGSDADDSVRLPTTALNTSRPPIAETSSVPNEQPLASSRLSSSEHTVEGRRAYPSIVIRSIFTMLFLLILRRVIMVVQS